MKKALIAILVIAVAALLAGLACRKVTAPKVPPGANTGDFVEDAETGNIYVVETVGGDQLALRAAKVGEVGRLHPDGELRMAVQTDGSGTLRLKKAGDEVNDPKTGKTLVVTEVVRDLDGVKTSTLELAPKRRGKDEDPLAPDALERLRNGPVTVSSVLEASGEGEYANLGARWSGGYYYVTTVRARSEIVKREKGEDGRILVEERREFKQARDHLSVSNVDVAVDLSTVPIRETQVLVNGLCSGVAWLGGVIPGVAVGAKTVQAGANAAFLALHSVDGKSLRGLLGKVGVPIPQNVEDFVNETVEEWIEKHAAPVHSALQSIEGKAYIITYTQDADGKPLHVDFRHEGGEGISDAEWEILRSANAFLDQNVVPDTRCEVGDRWTVWADEMQEVFGLASDGKADGKIRVVRDDDQDDGDWTLKIEPSEIAYQGAGGAGTLAVAGGHGLVEADTISVKSIQATAKGALDILDKTRHWMLFEFLKETYGDASMRFTFTAEPVQNP